MDRPVFQYPFRELNDDERSLMNHISMWGSDGYPVRKVKSKWMYEYRSLQSPVLYATKREATAAFETYTAVLCDLLGQAAYRRALEVHGLGRVED